MIKKESIYSDDGELVTSRTTQFAGRFNDNRGYAAYYNGKTIMSRVDAVYHKDVTDMDIGKLTRLSKHLQPTTNHLGYKGNKGVKSMDAARIGEVIGIGESQARRFIKRMIDSGVMAQQGVRYHVNPTYYLNGKYVSDELYWLFKPQLNDAFPQWVHDSYAKRKQERDNHGL